MFDKFSLWLSRKIGTSNAFMIALAIVTGATIAGSFPSLTIAVNSWAGSWTGYLSVLLLILMSAAQKRSETALHAKMDEIVFVMEKANNELLRSEELTELEIEALRAK